MRYSPFPSLKTQTPTPVHATNEAFFSELASDVGVHALHGAILLVGARDGRSLAVRRAQAALRFDKRMSRWSHAALITRWRGTVLESEGLEVTLEPSPAVEQVPERNGVTPFRLARYADRDVFPNLAVAVLGFEPAQSEDGATAGSAVPAPWQRRRAVLEAAVSPNRQRERYPLWESLGVWARYAYAPYATPNPLQEGLPLPAASFVEYAYEAANVDLTPGASGNNNCPEVLYATMKHWSEGLRRVDGVSVRLFTLIRDEHGIPFPELSQELHVELPSPEDLGA
jgi:hypothetical protein